MSWTRSPAGYDVLFNRDERRSRKLAAPPQHLELHGVKVLAPRDGDSGGTWLGVNEHGLTVALLNGYVEPATSGAGADPSAAYTSRGKLVLELLDAANHSVVAERLRRRRLAPFRSFQLAAIDPAGASWASWDGSRLQLDTLHASQLPLVSSSFDRLGVTRARKACFQRRFANDREPTAVALSSFHRSHDPQAGPSSVCMHRPDAKTVSLSWIRVCREAVGFHYVAGSPCAALDIPPALRMQRTAEPKRCAALDQ